MTPDPISRRIGMLLAAAYGIIFFVMVPQAADMVVWPRLAVLSLGLAVGLLLAFRKSGELLVAVPLPIRIAFGLYILWGALGMFTAHDLFFAGYDTARMLVFAAWLMLLAWMLQRVAGFLPLLLRLLSVVALVQSLVGLAQIWAGLFMWIPPSTYPPFGFMASSNYYGEGMLMLAVLSAGCTILNRGTWRWLGLAATVLSLAATLAAHARTVQLGLVAVLLLVGFCVWTLRLRERKVGKLPFLLKPGLRWALFLLILMGIGAGAYVLRQDKFASASLENVRFASDSEVERIVIWKESLHIMREHPLWGVGPGNWKYHVLERGIVSSFQGFATRYFMRGHNDFLQAFAERGVVGGLAFLLLWLLGMFFGIRRLERSTSREEGVEATMGLCGLMGWAVIASFGFPMERTEECLLWLLFLAISVVPAGKPGFAAKSSAWPSKLLVGLLMVLSLGFSVLTLLIVQADIHGRNIALAKGAQDWYSVHREAKAAQHWYYPGQSVSNTPVEWFIGTAALLRGDQAGAFTFLEAAYQKHPWHPHVVSNYGTSLYSNGQREKGTAILEQLIEVYPEFHEVRVNLNEIYLADKQMDKVEKNLTFWENHVKPRDISLYLEQVKTRMESISADTFSRFE